jgi:hypothetical protein
VPEPLEPNRDPAQRAQSTTTCAPFCGIAPAANASPSLPGRTGSCAANGPSRWPTSNAASASDSSSKERPTTTNNHIRQIDRPLRIQRTKRSPYNGGTWVRGTLAGHAFEALVFAEHAESESYELERSRISKLCVRDAADRVVACFDRGWDRTPDDEIAQAIIDLLAAELAEAVFGK